jgi:hypothetical protein
MAFSASSLKGPKPRWFTGNLAEFRADRLAFFTRCAREYGDVVPLRILSHRPGITLRPRHGLRLIVN